MPLWLEMQVLMLIAFGAGFGIGWLAANRRAGN